MKRLPSLEKLNTSYLFFEIEKRKRRFLCDHPNVDIVDLGIGDTIFPLPSSIAKAMEKGAFDLSQEEGYSGYGQAQGMVRLRQILATNIYHEKITPDEIFISDGAKCDIGRLQILFNNARSVGLQDPTYPVYLDGSMIQGIPKVYHLPCIPDNGFLPHLPPKLDLLYICNPNNPTGMVYNHEQLQRLIDYAKKNHTIILVDSTYSSYIQDSALPRSIYEIQGAHEVAIEINSFSKMVGFSGVRLGWTVLPKELTFECGRPVWPDWHRLYCTIFNGASNIAQKGGIAVFTCEKWRENICYYMKNASYLKQAFQKSGYAVYGGENAPYLWVSIPNHRSWDVFQYFLEKKRVIITPGVGYGSSGEHFIRVSSFNRFQKVQDAADRIDSSLVQGKNFISKAIEV